MMKIQEELRMLMSQALTPELTDKLLAAYLEEAAADCADNQQECREGMKALADTLTGPQKTQLDELFHLHKESLCYAVKFGFSFGLYTGFAHYFSKERALPFEGDAFKRLQSYPAPVQNAFFHEKRKHFHAVYDSLFEQLGEEMQEHLTSIDLGLEAQEYGVLRHAFHLGYRGALELIETVDSDGSTLSIMDKILLTEYELGFTGTCQDRERQAERMSRKSNATNAK